MVITEYAEELNFEFELMMNVEKSYKQHVPVYFRDVNKFCPKIFRLFSKFCESQNIDNSMMNDGILYLDTDK